MTLVGWENSVEVPSTILTASSQAVSMSPDMLRVPLGSSSVAWQTPAGTVSASLTIASLVAVPWRAACLARTNLTPSATMRVRVGALEAFAEATPLFAASPITPGWTPTGTVTRAHTPSGAMATYFAAGGVLTEAAQSIPRVAYDPVTGERLGWLLEPERTNLATNPRGEGGTPGTGTFPTTWGIYFETTGMTAVFIGRGSEDGMPYVDIRVYGTATGAGRAVYGFHAANIAATALAKYSQSMYIKGIAGTQQPIILNPVYSTSGVAYISEAYSPAVTPNTGALKTQRRVLTDTSPSTTGLIAPRFIVNLSAGATYDFTIRVGAPQFEAGEFATSPILPPVGSPQTATRGYETFSTTLSALGGATFYSNIQIEKIPSAVQECTVVTLQDNVGSSFVRHRSVSYAGSPTLDAYSVNAGASNYNSVQSSVIAASSRNRMVTSVTASSFANWANGVALANQAGVYAPQITNFTNFGCTPSNDIHYVRELRVYAPLTDAQALALSGTGSTLIAPAYDSGTVSAGVTFGIGQALHVLPSAVSALQMKIDINDPTNPDGFLNVPLAYAGPAYDFGMDMRSTYGTEVRRNDTTTRGGVIITEALSKARGWQLSTDLLDEEDIDWVNPLEAAAAAGINILMIPRPTYTKAAGETVYGLLTSGRRGFVTQVGDIYNWSANISERL